MSVSEDACAARVIIGSKAATFELWRWGSQDQPLQSPRAYLYPKIMPSISSYSDGMRIVLTEAPEAKLADLLLVSFDRDYEQPEKDCFKGELSLCEHLTHPPPSSSPLLVSPWVTVLASSMRWCMLNSIKVPQVAGIKALDDCFASTERLMSKGQWKVKSDWYSGASDRCLVASLQREIENNHGLGPSSALAVAHILRQKGDGKKTQSSLSGQPKEVVDFVAKYSGYAQKRMVDHGKSC